MKNIAILNSCYDFSTGKIAFNLHKYLLKRRYNSFLCYATGNLHGKENSYKIESYAEVCLHALYTRLFGEEGTRSKRATKRFIRFLEENDIDTIYCVNLHGYYINRRIFLDYVAKKGIKLIYIMGDEYPFLGRCGYSNGCTNYLHGCGNCPQLKEYPVSWFFDKSRQMFKEKQETYAQLDYSQVIFVGPEYTITAAKKSPLLKGKRLEIVDEAVDTDFYIPQDTTSLKKELGITDNQIVLVCIAPMSYERKGCRYFIELARRFESDERYAFVHVGYDIKDHSNLTRNYKAIGVIKDQNLLAHYYSLGDLFVFPSLLDTMPNACLEAMSCGSPLLCFNVSGMPYIADKNTATFVDAKNVDQMVEVVKNLKKKDIATISKCRNYAVSRYSNKLYYEKLEALGLELSTL